MHESVQFLAPAWLLAAVERVEADEYGEFEIHLNRGYRLQAFPSGTHSEDWRLFEPGYQKSHFVIAAGRVAEGVTSSSPG
jgi:hypothetical protein